jgi:hypothetical protein
VVRVVQKVWIILTAVVAAEEATVVVPEGEKNTPEPEVVHIFLPK